MVNQLNEEIMGIKHTIAHKRKMMTLTPKSSVRSQLRKDIDELEVILLDKLSKTGDL